MSSTTDRVGMPAATPLRSRRQRLRTPLMLLAPVVVLVGAATMYATGGRYVATDDAYVQAARVAISADISARVENVAVHENQHVNAGDVLFTLQHHSFDIAAADARAQVAAAKLQIAALKASYGQRQAELKAAQDTRAYQLQRLARAQRLLGSGVSTQAQIDEINHDLDAANQAIAASQQQIASVLASLGGDADIAPEQHPMVQQAQAKLDAALLNLSYTVVRAPESGIVTKVEQLQAGDYVNLAAPLFSLLSDTRIWVEANFKETDLTHMRPGQNVTVEVDTYPDVTFEGHLESLSPGTGSSFSLLPPENATGNWVKVVQRLPVRIALAPHGADTPLHAGLSATVMVDTGHRNSLADLLPSFLGARK